MSNPSVNRCLKDLAMDHIDHALGRPVWPLRETYREYFAANTDGEHAREFEASPHWRRGGSDGRLTYFYVTDEGRKALAKHLAEIGAARAYTVSFNGFDAVVPATSASKARYSYFLDVRDVCPDLTFLAFTQDARVRLATCAGKPSRRTGSAR